MPKLKTKSSIKKRFSLTATGKVKRTTAFKRHCLISRPQKMKRNARRPAYVSDSFCKLIKRFLNG